MIEAIKESLTYYSTHFAPYPYRQMRIIEFPRYRRFAQSFPNTVPYSEGAHFITDLRDTDNIDMVFYITCHEVAHQWWGNVVLPAGVQGGEMISESLSQYSALMVMEKNFGREKMKRFLAYELNHYLTGRGREREEELPLARVEHQNHVYYNKGSLIFYALRDYIGEDTLNSALRRFLDANAYKGPPYATTPGLLGCLRDVTPEHYQYLIEDMFERITLYDNRAESATAVPIENGRYRVRLAYQSHKFYADGWGAETEADHTDWIEVGVFGEGVDGKEGVLHLAKHRIASGTGEIEIIVDEKPVRAGIDPRNLLIDRVATDNVKRVSS